MARPRPHLHTMLSRPSGAGALPTHDADGRPLIRLQTLGAVSLLVGDLRLGASTGPIFSLLLRVASAPGLQLRGDELRRQLWPDLSDVRQRGNLRQALYKLRGYGARITMETGVVVLDPSQRLATFSVQRSADLFARDVTLGHEPFGTYLPGYTVPWPGMQQWIDEQRELVHADVRRVLADQLQQRRDRADWSGAEALARWLLQFDPLNDEATLTVAECTAMSGSRKEALAILDRYLAELGPGAGELRLSATVLRRRLSEPLARGRRSFAPTERHFVGRGEELSALTLSMRRARWHDGSAVLLHGAPGMGKSRLAHELEKVAVVEGVRVVQASCRESDVVRPLSVFLDLVPEVLQCPGALGCAPESLAALRRLVPQERVWPGASTDSPSTAATAMAPSGVGGDAAAADVPVLSREPMPMAAALRRALIDLLAAVSDEKPMLLIVDDVHWIDEQSWDVLADLVDRVQAMRVFVLLTSREPHARLQRPQRSPLALEVRALPPLSAASCLQLSRAIGEDLSAPVSDELGAWFVRASEGIPLFLRALVNHWIETGEAGGVPPTLQGVIEQRLSQLSGDALRVLQTAALLGKWATVERVGRVLELGSTSLLAVAVEIESNNLVAKATETTIVCHELVSQQALRGLQGLATSIIHSRIATILQTDFEELGDPKMIWPVLRHWHAGNDNRALLAFAVAKLHVLTHSHHTNEILQLLETIPDNALSSSERMSLASVCSLLRVESGRYREELDSRCSKMELPDPNESMSELEAEQALSLIDSAYRSELNVDLDALCDYAIQVAGLHGLQRCVRLRAASIGLVIATNQCDADRVEKTWQQLAISDLSASASPDEARVAVMYHAVLGDRGVAGMLASELLSRAKADPPSLCSILDALRSAFALRLTSQNDNHLDAFEFAFNSSSVLSLSFPAMTAAWQLAQCALESGAIDKYRTWSSVLSRLHNSESDRISGSFAVALSCRDAIERQDTENAKRLLSEFLADLPERPTVRAACHARALETAILLMDQDWKPESSSLKPLLQQFERVARFGTSDFVASVVAEAFARIDRAGARSILRRYLDELRREISKPSVRLLAACEACGVTVVAWGS